MNFDFLKTDEKLRLGLYEYLEEKSEQATSDRFPVGSRLYVLSAQNENYMKSILVRPENTIYIAGTVTLNNYNGGKEWSACLVSDDGLVKEQWLRYTDRVVDIKHMERYLLKHNVGIELDTTHLDKLVLEAKSKAEIIAVLKQQHNFLKIFEDWGLNDILEYGKAMSLLFYGKPGTGKTWAANCIAKALGKELLTVSGAQIQTSEPGGAERNIQDAFAQATKKGMVLFFDECDSMITDRADVGMILASEINTLLTCLEKFDGVVIFATNRADTLDSAMERRISLAVEFPVPDEATRVEIWKTLLPAKMPLEDGVSVEKLAKFELTGGYIKNVILNAARYAASEDATCVTREHFARAIKRINATKNIMGTHTSRRGQFVRATEHVGVEKDVEVEVEEVKV